MISRLHLSSILLAAAAIWGLALLLIGVDVKKEWLQPFSMVIGALVLLLAAFDLFLWRARLLQGWFVKRPALWGTWRVTIKTNWGSADAASIDGFMCIRQTFSQVSLRLLTEESSSVTLAEQISFAPDGTVRVYAIYRNEPNIDVRTRSSIHYGAILLDVQGTPPDTLAGHYWTDRGTAGSIILSDRTEDIYRSFITAQSHFDAEAGDALVKQTIRT